MIWLLFACSHAVDVGQFVVADGKDGSFDVTDADVAATLHHLVPFVGTASADVTMSFGAFKFDNVATTSTNAAHARRHGDGWDLTSAHGDDLGTLTFTSSNDRELRITLRPKQGTYAGFSADCDAADHFLGLGSHAFDVDHVGEAFSLWTSEPGIGKADTDTQPADWYLTGTRHSTSLAVPFLLRPQQGEGLLLDTTARVDVDLCHSDPTRFSVAAWDSRPLSLVLFAGDDGLDALRRFVLATGKPSLPPAWAFAPWNDAIGGVDRIHTVAAELRAAHAPSGVIWTEDWKGGAQTPQGYQISGEWDVDETLYPNPSGISADLNAAGFRWFAYFGPFVYQGTRAWDSALAANAIVLDDSGAPQTFTGATFSTAGLVDLTSLSGRAWAMVQMKAALDVGFSGWMADYGEWLPTDAVLASGEDPWRAHNEWPSYWQLVNGAAQAGHDATFFARSGWTGASALAPVIWGGDQRTSFQADDGLPTVVPLGLGASACGIPVFTHDVAGYQSVGNGPGDQELFDRWAALGAYSPILRTHHGLLADQNWQFDHDSDTLAFWATIATENMRLWPYRYGLAAQAATDGTPMIRPIGLQFPGEDVARIDAWMLGPSLLVAPITVQGATSRQVNLPSGVQWYDWHTQTPATSGEFQSPLGTIPVFAAAGTTVPTFTTVPDTLSTSTDAGLVTFDQADGERTVYLFGGGGAFVEGDGTTYAPTGEPTGSGTITQTLTSGSVDVAGVTLAITGNKPRAYTVIVVR